MPVSKGRNILIGYGLVIVLILAASFIGKACDRNTAAYAAADHFVRDDVTVSAKLGAVEETSMTWSSFSTGGRGTFATFKIAVRGTREHGTAKLDLEKRESVWRVTTASLVLSSGEVVALK